MSRTSAVIASIGAGLASLGFIAILTVGGPPAVFFPLALVAGAVSGFTFGMWRDSK